MRCCFLDQSIDFVKNRAATTPLHSQTSLALLTDLYELTMASGYWKSGIAEREAVFYLAFREPPFEGGFTIACGLAAAIDFLSGLRFDDSDLAYLATVIARDQRPLFEEA